MDLYSPVSSLSGVGEARTKLLRKLGIETLFDLICSYPRSYENRGDICLLSALDQDAPHAYLLTVASEVKNSLIRKNLTISKFRAFDDSGSCEVVFFNSPYIRDLFHIGKTFRFYGKISKNNKRIQLSNPKYEEIEDGKELANFHPIYPLTEGLSSNIFKKLVDSALFAVKEQITDPLPDSIRIENSLSTLKFAIENIHSPENAQALASAIKRLSFDEMFYFALGISLSSQYKNAVPGVRFNPCRLTEFTNLLPYELTDSQKSAINDIYTDTVIKTKDSQNGHMARIIVGDVGCGKTVCAAAAVYMALKSGYQAAIMAPTEILARQHFNELMPMFEKLGYKTDLLLGASTKKEKNKIYENLKNASTSLVIGTHAILSDKVEFKHLGLIVTDEQHRFGVAQRAVLNEKNESAHMLVMSATPIPRTLALAMYGDLDISRIKELPKGRQATETYLVDEGYRSRLENFILNQIKLGGQCYIVCPAITDSSEEDKESSNVKNVLEYAENMRQKFPALKIATLHGKLKSKEKDDIMLSFSSGETKVLISTTVVEVGVNNPNASLMIIEDADRFGLSQLHQLRGRVGRGTRKSYCVMVSSLNSEKARARLEVMKTTSDGFEIANKDLELRGPGDFFASKDSETLRQSGGFEFKLTKFTTDTTLFNNAFSAAKTLINHDPELCRPENALIKKELSKHISPMKATIS